MGLIIKSTETKKITITGTSIELPEIYARLEFAGREDGKTLEVAIKNYASLQAYNEKANPISTNVPTGSAVFKLENNEIQSLETAHKYAKISLEQEGFEVINN